MTRLVVSTEYPSDKPSTRSSKLLLFETCNIDFAALLHATNELELVAVRRPRSRFRWAFFDPEGRGDELARRFDAGACPFDRKGLPAARDTLLRSSAVFFSREMSAAFQSLPSEHDSCTEKLGVQ